ncbi:MAG TPA: hypothetical protein VLA92_02975 [Candidatus Saccharimonadales bacterium]|nr:hypothetical protein [Candidatus Saccharimonadales bacterium]
MSMEISHIYQQEPRPGLGEAMPGQEILRVVTGPQPPHELRPLTVPETVERRLATPSNRLKDQPLYRHDGVRGIDYAIASGQLSVVERGHSGMTLSEWDDILDDRDRFLWNAELTIAELDSNTVLHGGGLAGVDLASTPDGKLYIAARNLALIYPKGGVQHLREGRSALQFGRNAIQSGGRMGFNGETTVPNDEHGRGGGILGKLAEQHGMFQIAYPEVPQIDVRDEHGAVLGQVSLLQTVSWAVLGRPKPPMALFDSVDLEV